MIGSLDYQYHCKIIRWLDGDTVEVDIDLGFGIHRLDVVRIAGINSPERKSSVLAESQAGMEALSYASSIAPPGLLVRITSYKSGKEKYGRWLARLNLPDGSDFGRKMLEAKHAIAYLAHPL